MALGRHVILETDRSKRDNAFRDCLVRSMRHLRFAREADCFARGTDGSNPCTLQSGYWLVGIVDWPAGPVYRESPENPVF